MKLTKDNFTSNDTIEITNVRNIDTFSTTPSILEVIFDGSKVVSFLDGQIISVGERFTKVNNWLKNNPDFDTIVDDDVRKFEL